MNHEVICPRPIRILQTRCISGLFVCFISFYEDDNGGSDSNNTHIIYKLIVTAIDSEKEIPRLDVMGITIMIIVVAIILPSFNE